ncbi:Transmembrane protein adipocyte-associated 1-like, partial [Homarus americanus]
LDPLTTGSPTITTPSPPPPPTTTTTTTTTTTAPDNTTTTQPPFEKDGFCKLILYMEIGDSRVRVWDLLLLLPTLLFLIGLLLKINSARPVACRAQPYICNILWPDLAQHIDICGKMCCVNDRVQLLPQETLPTSHLDNKTSIRRVLVVTSMIALPYSVVQGALEVLTPDHDFDVPSKDYELFGHGGSLFWLISSIFFTLIYSFILVLRLDWLRKLSFSSGCRSIGSGLYHVRMAAGLCLVNATTWTYFSLLAPLIYYTFISEFFGQKSREQVENIVFSYKSEDDDDTSSLPLPGTEFPQQNIYQSNSAPYSSLSEEVVGDGQTPVNPLYTASLQSPDSITGYSINSVDDITINAYNKHSE